MLSSLRIQNIVLIDQLTINFKSGLCALTGETGAGKSILLDSLGLALGGRSESRFVRKGCDDAHVIAVFDLGDVEHVSYQVLCDAGVSVEAGEALILRRTVNKDGRSKAFINDQPVSVALLKQVGEMLVEVHGQFETQGLLDTKMHRPLLDEYAQIDESVGALWSAWKILKDEVEDMRLAAQNARADETYLRQSIEDLDALDPCMGEESMLSTLRDRLMNREQVLDALNNAYQILNDENDPVRKAWGILDRVAEKLGPEGEGITEALSRSSSEAQEALSLIQAMSIDMQESEHSLETIDDRLFALRAQARKHECDIDDLAQIREALLQRLNMIEHGDSLLKEKLQAVDEAREAYTTKAKQVSAMRKSSAAALDELVQKELAPLKLEKARFVTSVEVMDEAEWGAHGMDRVRFLVATNPGARPGPLGKIASGGEMSRFMLALKVVMSEIGVAESLVFDEVDAGIGGATADAVGERLAKLAQTKQIMVVTHAPQVAARAANHYIVHKQGDETVTTHVSMLETHDKRSEEIARMLAGATITQEARAAADKLLEIGEAA